MVSRLLKAWFGNFSSEELKKFIKLGVTFGLIIAIYWTLRPLKDSLFQNLVGATFQPYAKIVSLIVLAPLVILYSRLVERLPRATLFYLLAGIYGMLTLGFAFLMSLPSIGLESGTASPYNILGWAWYVFVESFGSLVIALFWAFTTDITTPESGKRGFSLVVMIGQIGGILAPWYLPKLPVNFPNYFTLPMLVGLCGVLTFSLIPLLKYFLATTPSDQLKGFKDKKEEPEDAPADRVKSPETEPGFLEGLRLMISQPYLLGIFGIIFFYEVIVTVIDYHFKLMTKAQIGDTGQVNAYLGEYAFYANLLTFLCLLFGISNITRRLGVKTSLALMPFVVGAALLAFNLSTTLGVLFWIMVGAKAVNYALNGPAQKQLYVPVSDDARYKSQAWIETFGSRGSKAGGAGINIAHKPLMVGLNAPVNGASWSNFSAIDKFMYGAKDLGSYWHILGASIFFFGVCGVWFVVALYLGGTYQKAVDKNKIVC